MGGALSNRLLMFPKTSTSSSSSTLNLYDAPRSKYM